MTNLFQTILKRLVGETTVKRIPDKSNRGPRVKCLHCGDVIQSHYCHDFRYCSCKAIFIDGGNAYTRFGPEDNARYKWIKDERDLDATLVGPRDTSQDREWCYKCEQLVLRSSVEEREVTGQIFNEEITRTVAFCKVPCELKKGDE